MQTDGHSLFGTDNARIGLRDHVIAYISSELRCFVTKPGVKCTENQDEYRIQKNILSKKVADTSHYDAVPLLTDTSWIVNVRFCPESRWFSSIVTIEEL